MSRSIEKLLPDNAYWKYFLKICSIPHPSGHEEKLRDFLVGEAVKYNLQYRVDNAGNLAIDRPAAKGYEHFPTIILQSHLDMVPQAAAGVEFDFLTDSIEPIIEDDWVTTGNRTTLGADDGMGVALTMELLTDATLQCGALRGVFTVSEETGLGGAENIDRAFLDADILFNLDSDAVFTIGCAGGSCFEGKQCFAAQSPLKKYAVKLTLRNMHGGHSGVDIHRNFGSAAAVMGKLLAEIGDLEIAAVNAGTLHNAIAREAEAVIVLDETQLNSVETLLKSCGQKLNTELVPAENNVIELCMERLSELPGSVLTSEAKNTFLQIWNDLPHGVLAATPAGDSESSCNLAVISGNAGNDWSIIMSVRSLYDSKRIAITDDIMKILSDGGFSVILDTQYTSWEPRWNSPVLQHACKIYEEFSGKEAQKLVIHGGLEPGIFSGMNPDLEMLSFAPATQNVHSPQERLSISNSESIRSLLRKLVSSPLPTVK